MTITPLRLILMAGLLAIAPLAGPTAASEFKRISTEAEFRAAVVGKKLYFDKNYVTVKKNGTLSGNFGGQNLKGAWEWRDGFWCRTLTTHSKNTDCQEWTVSGNTYVVTRNRGKGKGFTYVAK